MPNAVFSSVLMRLHFDLLLFQSIIVAPQLLARFSGSGQELLRWRPGGNSIPAGTGSVELLIKSLLFYLSIRHGNQRLG